ncbi:Putative uncharacterized protein [Moritella viscosa]|uniref:Uncharacterized protein n=1 Tax=Moritella viscosa TaxID=80854 RepID=A0ABY1HAT4_9GAMM|nr:Putative uncharacterized protein [Moritella viscosa]
MYVNFNQNVILLLPSWVTRKYVVNNMEGCYTIFYVLVLGL